MIWTGENEKWNCSLSLVRSEVAIIVDIVVGSKRRSNKPKNLIQTNEQVIGMHGPGDISDLPYNKFETQDLMKKAEKKLEYKN